MELGQLSCRLLEADALISFGGNALRATLITDDDLFRFSLGRVCCSLAADEHPTSQDRLRAIREVRLERELVPLVAAEILAGRVLARMLLLRATVELTVSNDVFFQITQSLLEVLQRRLASQTHIVITTGIHIPSLLRNLLE